MTIVSRPTPSQEDIELTDKIYAKAIELGFGPSQRPSRLHQVLTVLYYGFILLFIGWIFSMAIDRAVPVETAGREVMNHGRKVAQGSRLLVRSTRKRVRSCELTRRWTVIDGDGRRFDFEPEHFDGYGPVTAEDGKPEVETTGPIVPLDAAPGRGRWISVLGWDCNPLQRAIGWSIVQILPAIEFEIVPREIAPDHRPG